MVYPKHHSPPLHLVTSDLTPISPSLSHSFPQYVDTLQEQLADLEDSGKIKAAVFDHYRQQVRSIASQLQKPDLPSYCLSINPQQQPPAAAMPIIPPAPLIRPQQQPQGHKHVTSTSKKPTNTTNDKELKVKVQDSTKTTTSPSELRLSDKAKTQLISEHAIQDNIADELLGLTAALKTNTLAMEGKLKERGELLDTTEEALDKSVTGAKASAGKATALHKRGRLNLCLTCLIMLIIGSSFAGMFMFIRVTRFAGYKRAVAVKNKGTTTGDSSSINAGGQIEQPTTTGTDDTYYYYYDNDQATKQEF